MATQEDYDKLLASASPAGPFGQLAPDAAFVPPEAPQSHESAPANLGNIPITADIGSPAAPTAVNPQIDLAKQALAATSTPQPAPVKPQSAGTQPSAVPTVPGLANPLAGPEGLDTNAAAITSSFDGKTAQIDQQKEALLAAAGDGPGSQNALKALDAQKALLERGKTDALRTNASAFDMYEKDDNGNYRINPAKLPKTLTPGQVRQYDYENANLGQKGELSIADHAKAALEASSKADAAAADARAAGLNQIAALKQKQATETTAHDEAYKTGLAAENDKARRAVEDYNKSVIDPNHFWKEASTPGLIGVAILAGLTGAFNNLASIQSGHGPSNVNPVLDRINQLIANDIDAQKSNLAKKGKDVEFANNSVSQFRSQGYDEKQSEQLAHIAALDQVKTQIDATIAQNDSTKAKSLGEYQKSQIDLEQQRRYNQVMAPYFNDIARGKIPTGPAGGFTVKYDKDSGSYFKVNAQNKIIGYASPSEAKVFEETNKLRDGKGPTVASDRLQGSRTVELPDGKKIVYDNPVQAKQAQTDVSTATKTIRLLDELGKAGVKESNGPGIPLTSAQKDHNQNIDNLTAQLQATVPRIGNPNAPTAEEQHNFGQSINPGTSNPVSRFFDWVSPDNKNTLDTVRKEAEETIHRVGRLGADKGTTKPATGSDEPERESDDK